MIHEKKRVAILSVIAAVFLSSFKLVVGLITGSLGILSEALHSGIDLVAAVITYFSVRVSDKPADKEHHFGHGKIENLSALIETLLLLVTCAWIIYEATQRLLSGKTHIEVNTWSYIVVISSIIIDLGRSKALFRVARKYNSQALEADGLHFATDIWSSMVVLVGLVCASFGFYIADSIAALGVSIIVLSVSFRLGKRSIDVLLDRAPDGINMKVKRVIDSFPEIKYFHGLKIRSSGARTFIKVNIHLNPDISLNTAHGICDRLEQAIRLQIPRSEVYIHAEPQEKTHLLRDKKERISVSLSEF